MTKPRRKKEVIGALEKLGFVSGRSRGKHVKYIYFDPDGIKRTTVPVPKGRGEIPIGTLEAIQARMHLDHKQFDGALVCPFGRDEYIIHMKALVRDGRI